MMKKTIVIRDRCQKKRSNNKNSNSKVSNVKDKFSR